MVGGGGEAGAHSTSPTYTVRKDRPARDPSSSALWLQKPSILRVCVREEDAGEREAGVHSTTPTYRNAWYKKDPTPGGETSQRPPSEGFCFVCPSLYFLLHTPV